MNIADMIKTMADQIIEPEAGALNHFRDFSSMQEHLQEAEADYDEVVKLFNQTDPGSWHIMEIIAQANEAGF